MLFYVIPPLSLSEKAHLLIKGRIGPEGQPQKDLKKIRAMTAMGDRVCVYVDGGGSSGCLPAHGIPHPALGWVGLGQPQ